LLKWNCPVWQCEISRDRTDIQDYDAVIFHLHTWTLNDLPQRRSSHQRYVAWMLESAAWHEYYYDTNPMANFFNWTVTYRWDSDFVRPYGYVKPIGNVPIHPNESQMKEYLSNSKVMPMDANGKTKMATWFVSNCNSEKSSRDELVKQLQNYMQIDVFGKCGTFACRKNDELNDSSEQCQEMAALNYKFYLSLENSLCQDYITEKLDFDRTD
jgi:alpha-1,3-fucosyltransferase